MQKFRVLAGLTLLCTSIIFSNKAQAASSDPILAVAFTEDRALIRSYNSAGQANYETSLPIAQVERVISGRWNQTSNILALSQFEKTQKANIINSSSAVVSSFNLPSEPINTVFAADLNNNGYSDLVAVVHAGNKAKVYVYSDPGISSAAPSSFNLAVQTLYYAPAVAGNTTIGFLAYNPPGAKVSAAKTAKAKKKKGGKKKKDKNKGKGNSKAGNVYQLDTAGNIIKTFNIAKSLDGQILPFSADGTCGFGIRKDSKLKLYDGTGKFIKDVAVATDSSIVLGDFSGSGNLNQALIGESKNLKLLNMITGTSSSITLSGLPDQLELIEKEISRLNDEFLAAFKNNAPLSEMMRIRDELLELQNQKKTFSGSINLGDRLSRLFTGGAGAIEGVCDVVYENPKDGYGGFLAKNGDYSSKIVILTPGGKNFEDAELIKFGSYKVITKLKDSGFGNPDSRGMRKHWRGDKTVQGYGKFIFRAKYKSNPFSATSESHCWFIKEPASRID